VEAVEKDQHNTPILKPLQKLLQKKAFYCLILKDVNLIGQNFVIIVIFDFGEQAENLLVCGFPDDM